MRTKFFSAFSASIFAILFMVGVGFSQSTSGNLAGTVKDITGAVIPVNGGLDM